MLQEHNRDRPNTAAGRSIAGNISSKAVSRPAVAPVQRKEPFDSMAKEAWDALVRRILNYSYQISPEFDISEEDVSTYLTHELGIANPHSPKFQLDNKGEYNDYVAEFENVKTEKVAADCEEKNKMLHLKKQWSHYESLDEVPGRDKEDELYYSSEEDEVPQSKEEFDWITSVIQHLNSILEDYLSDSAIIGKFSAVAKSVIEKIASYKKAHPHETFPTKGFNVVKIKENKDWLGFGQAFREAKGDGGQKPTVYNLEYPIWSDPTHKEIPFRGRQLKTATGTDGRSWPAIAISLNELAVSLGTILTKAVEDDAGRAGTRILAAAMLAILGGRGDEVKAFLLKNGFKDLQGFEEVVLEFFALTLGIESVRMAFGQLDVVLHLTNIAKGRTVGGNSNRYTFLNVFAPIRPTRQGIKHVYTTGQYLWHRRRKQEGFEDLNENEIINDITDTETDMSIAKEVTEYSGFNTASPEQSDVRPRERTKIKSAKSAGKSSFSHSAGHRKTEKFFAGNKEIMALLWDQLRRIEDRQNRREVHTQRLFAMGPIRVYNLLANILKRHFDKIVEMPPKIVAGYLLDLYTNFMHAEQVSSDNPFYGELPTLGSAGFDFTVNEILQSEKLKKVDMDLVAFITQLLKGDKGKLGQLSELYKTREQDVRDAVVYILRNNQIDEEGNTILHKAVMLDSADLVHEFIKGGADLQAENKHGETPLALAIKLGQEGIVGLIVHSQDKQKERKKARQLPEDWQNFTKKKKLGESWLVDNEVHGLLNQANLPGTHIAPAVDIAQHPDLLAQFIRDNYLTQVQQGPIQPYTVIPINFNNAHWATLVIVQNANRRSKPTIHFFDSLGSDEEKINLLKMMLRMTGVYTRVDRINDFSLSLQNDGYTCGTWMVESATTIVSMLQAGAGLNEIQDALRDLQKVIQELHRQNLNITNAAVRSRDGRMKRRIKNPPKSMKHKGATIILGNSTWAVESFEETGDDDDEFEFQLVKLGEGIFYVQH